MTYSFYNKQQMAMLELKFNMMIDKKPHVMQALEQIEMLMMLSFENTPVWVKYNHFLISKKNFFITTNICFSDFQY